MLIKTELLGYRKVKKTYYDMLSRVHLIPERHGQMDGRSVGQTDLLSRVSMLTRDKNVYTVVN